MFETSKDILFIVISFCILWATFFLCWMFFYAGKILKNTNQIIEEFRVRLQSLAEAISNIQEKVEIISSCVGVAVKGAGGVIKDALKERARSWVENKSEDFSRSAKEAVDRAMDITADKVRKAAKKIKK